MGLAPQQRDEVATDLKATLAAWREIGADMNSDLVDVLMARIDGYVASEVARRTDHLTPALRRSSRQRPARRHHTAQATAWGRFVVLAAFLAAVSLAFGVHVHAVPVIAAV